MIYLKNTTSPQTVFVPLAMDSGSDPAGASVRLVSTAGLPAPVLSGVSVRRAGTAGGWLAVTLSLPADTVSGSYEYSIEAGGVTFSSGCAQIGEYVHDVNQYDNDITFKQYERK